ncbi:unnamed protein product [Pleuronectes platessa]|uniref:Uncharacterized protein n=1 Tax=Pleuronectes platessa TaxID=8262 RepID=A0A9N7V1Y0_PLEPL|nr:unnamed protein product [Pleuronectes platessa]
MKPDLTPAKPWGFHLTGHLNLPHSAGLEGKRPTLSPPSSLRTAPTSLHFTVNPLVSRISDGRGVSFQGLKGKESDTSTEEEQRRFSTESLPDSHQEWTSVLDPLYSCCRFHSTWIEPVVISDTLDSMSLCPGQIRDRRKKLREHRQVLGEKGRCNRTHRILAVPRLPPAPRHFQELGRALTWILFPSRSDKQTLK